MKSAIINWENKEVGSVDLPESVFGVKWNPVLVRQVLIAQLANRRRPWANTKTRGEVRGGGKKPWRQKGTGRARHGSTRSPIWVGGGVAHGPRAERDYSQKVNKKMRRLAIMSILSKKVKDGEVKIMQSLELAEPKTNLLAKNLKPLLGMTKKARKYDALLIPNTEDRMIYRATSNLQKAKALNPEALNVYDLMNYKQILLDKDAVEVIAKHYTLTK